MPAKSTGIGVGSKTETMPIITARTTPVASAAARMSPGKTMVPAKNLLARILKSLWGIDFQKNIALFRRSAENASAK